MPNVRIFVHVFWATKHRNPIISKELKSVLLPHIKSNSIKKNIHIDCLNCVTDHIHLLISMGSEDSIAKIVMLLKGESSYWVNKEKLTREKFEWQDEYSALSVNSSALDRLRAYIYNQKEHHRKKTYVDECEAFLRANQFDISSSKI